jgi:hypothetical protein
MFLTASAGLTSKIRYTQQLRFSVWNFEINEQNKWKCYWKPKVSLFVTLQISKYASILQVAKYNEHFFQQKKKKDFAIIRRSKHARSYQKKSRKTFKDDKFVL